MLIKNSISENAESTWHILRIEHFTHQHLESSIQNPVSVSISAILFTSTIRFTTRRGGSGRPRGERPVDVKENGIGGAAADSEPVPDILKNEH
jgi:hypothetical protein